MQRGPRVSILLWEATSSLPHGSVSRGTDHQDNMSVTWETQAAGLAGGVQRRGDSVI